MRIFRHLGHALVRMLVLIGMLTLPLAVPAQQTGEGTETSYTQNIANNLDLSENDLRLLTLPMKESDLAGLADVWQDHLQSKIEENIWLNIKLKKASGAKAKAIREKIIIAATALDLTQRKYQTVLTGWEQKGADPSALTLHTKYAAAVVDNVSVIATTIRTLTIRSS